MLHPNDKALDATMELFSSSPGPFHTATATINGHAHVVFDLGPQTLRDYFDMATMHGDKTFIVFAEERYSFAQAHALAYRWAAAIQSRFGIAKGDRVALAMRNFPEWIFAFMGLTVLGAVVVPINAWWTGEEIAYAVDHSGARLIIADEERGRRLSEAQPHHPPIAAVRTAHQVAEQMHWVVMDDILASAEPRPYYIPPLTADDDATILYTSGSTGNPKGAVSTHRGAITGVMGLLMAGLASGAVEQQNGIAPPEQLVALLTVPLFHVTGSHAVFMPSILAGRALIFMYKWDPTEALRLIEAEKVTYFVGVPTMSLELMMHPDRDKYDLSSLRDVGAGGAARPAEHVARLAQAFKGKSPGLGYGLTETNALSVVARGEGYVERPASTGRPIKPLMKLRIVREDGTEAALGEAGEICMYTAACVRGYWHNPTATAAAFTEDGWFRTGDLGYLDEDGYLFIVDRKKDLIIRGGENISCVEVESALYSHPAVAEASVFGLPDERLGEIVGAVVYPKPGEKLDIEALKGVAAEKIASFKLPAKIWMVETPLPRLGSGKIDKVSLRKTYRDIFATAHAA